MADEWIIRLSRDEALVLADYLHRWQQSDDLTIQHEAERVALWNFLALLERADDGTAFEPGYGEQLEAARRRLVPEE